MGRKRNNDDRHVLRTAAARQSQAERAEEVVHALMEHKGHFPDSRNAFALYLAATYGRVWQTMSGDPNRSLLNEVLGVLKDYDEHTHPEVWDKCGGYSVSYGPTTGGIQLVGAAGEMRLDHTLHMFSGDLHQQRSIATILRRRGSILRVASAQAHRAGDFVLATVLTKMEDQIDRQGFVAWSTVDEFYALMSERGFEVQG